MKNKRFCLGILAIALIFGMTVIGCEEEYSYTFVNQSSQTVTVSCGDLNPSNFTINPGQTKTATSSQSMVSIVYTPANLVDVVTTTGQFTFSDKN
jgi:hypothetical protein